MSRWVHHGHVLESFEESLKNLDIDYIDLVCPRYPYLVQNIENFSVPDSLASSDGVHQGKSRPRPKKPRRNLQNYYKRHIQ